RRSRAVRDPPPAVGRAVPRRLGRLHRGRRAARQHGSVVRQCWIHSGLGTGRRVLRRRVPPEAEEEEMVTAIATGTGPADVGGGRGAAGGARRPSEADGCRGDGGGTGLGGWPSVRGLSSDWPGSMRSGTRTLWIAMGRAPEEGGG